MSQGQFDSTFARQSGLDDNGVHPLPGHFREGSIKLLCAMDQVRFDLNAEGAGSKLDLLQERLRERILRIRKCGHAASGRQHLSDELNSFPQAPQSRRTTQ